MSTTMLGTKCDIPFYVTATALGKLGNPEGEVILTRGAHKHNVIQMIPTLASCSFDEIMDEAKDGQCQWLQLYVNKDRDITKRIVQHAEKRGCKGLFITVDAPQLGRREKDMRSKFDDVGSNVQSTGGDNVDRSQGAARAISSFIDPSLSWKDIPWFKSITKMPIILKGVQCVEDVIRAVEVGVDGVVLSNHGGRQLDTARSGVEVLAEVMPVLRARGWQDRIEVYIDGGVRRATDIIKAVALGAKGVGIGRPFLYAMSAYGLPGVDRAMQLLKDEMEMNMRLIGASSVAHNNCTTRYAWLERLRPASRAPGEGCKGEGEVVIRDCCCTDIYDGRIQGYNKELLCGRHFLVCVRRLDLTPNLVFQPLQSIAIHVITSDSCRVCHSMLTACLPCKNVKHGLI
jgi:L-lactate dehydrogenase (cytochrome)